METFEEKYADMPIEDLAKAMQVLREQHTAQKAKTGVIWAEHEFLSKKALPEIMEKQGLVSFVLDGIGRVEIRHEASCSIPKDKKEEVYQWLRENGYGDLIQGTINSSTFKAQVKKFIKDGEDFPLDLINFNPFSNAVLIQAK